MRFGQILGESLSVFGSNFVPFVLLALVIFLPVFGYQYWSHGQFWDEVQNASGWSGYHAVRRAVSHLSDRNWGAHGIYVLAALLLQGTLTYWIIQRLRKKRAGLARSVTMSAERFPLIFVTAFLLILLAALLFGVCLFALTFLVRAVGTITPLEAILLMVLCTIPSLFVISRYFVAVPAAVLEAKVGTTALKRSSELTSASRGSILGVIVLVFVFEIGLGLLLGLLQPDATASRSEYLQGVMIQTGVGAVLAAFWATCAAVTYYHTRVARDGLDRDAIERVFA